jgi:predicted GH43/DUF377 family glycosyl hydrolase
MEWIKRGLVYRVDQHAPKGTVRAMVPTPLLIDDSTIRVFLTICDADNVGRPYFVDLDAHDPTKLIACSNSALMEPGLPGTFDNRGIVCAQVIREADGSLLMYYSGFEPANDVRYRIFMGLARSTDHGEHFVRVQDEPILGPTTAESMFRCAPFVLQTEAGYRMWYTAGSSWETVNGKAVPRYSLKHLWSNDGIQWGDEGTPCMQLEDDEHGMGRPWITRAADGELHLYYSVRRISLGAYRMGYASSRDGLEWTRQDRVLGLDVSETGFDSQAMSYTALLTVHGKTYCFYNGNAFGQDGFAVAEMVKP